MVKYSVVLSDPPWSYDDKAAAGNRGSGFQYPTMTIHEICRMPVGEIVADDSVLFLWVTAPMILEQIRVMEAWGFKYKTIAFTWVKRAKNGGLRWGMGNWTRANAEYCVLGVRGKPKRISASIHSVIESVPGRHSEKPSIVMDRIVELMGDVPRLEMFARERVNGWDAHGYDVEDGIQIGIGAKEAVSVLKKRFVS